MKINRSNAIFLSFFLLFALFAGQSIKAQEREIVRLNNINGDNFYVTRNGERLAYTDEEIDRERITLENAGIVHTGAGTSIDITLLPSRTVIRMAENTSLMYNGLDVNRNFEDFSLLYGRLQVIAEGRARPIVIRGGRAAARFVNGSFGIDHMLEASEWNYTTQPQLRLNAFQGQAEFYLGGPSDQDALVSNQRQTVEAGESISIAGKMPLESDEHAYWDEQTPGTRGEGGGSREIVPPLPPAGYNSGSNRGRNITIGIGLSLTVASAAALVMTLPQLNIIKNDDLARNIHYSSFIPLGMGLATTLGGIMYNPARQ